MAASTICSGVRIRLADAQIDDVPPFCGQRGGTGEHGKGIFLADPAEGINCGEHGVISRRCARRVRFVDRRPL